MASVKSAKRSKKTKAAHGRSKSAKNGASKSKGRLRIAGGSGRIPDEILDTPGPSCPGAVDILLADRNR